jgi:hypothetical protein
LRRISSYQLDSSLEQATLQEVRTKLQLLQKHKQLTPTAAQQLVLQSQGGLVQLCDSSLP